MSNTENNKLIAEFMGLKTKVINNRVCVNTMPESPYPLHSEVQFHTSWDWLMPVVEKIHRQTDGFVTIKDQYCKIHNCNIGVMEDIVVDERQTIESVYTACVQFIQWYNSNQQDNGSK